MATLSAKKIQEALLKAQSVGLVEEPLTICGCNFVLSSLPGEDYEDIEREVSEIPEGGAAYFWAWKREHLIRSIVEINGVDLRKITYVEVEVEEIDPATRQPVAKTVRLEKTKFISDYVIRSWGREAIDVAFRKFLEVIEQAEIESAKAVKFITPAETSEDTYRRLLTEAKDLERVLSVDRIHKLREELGFLSAVQTPTEAEYKAALDKLPKTPIEEPAQAGAAVQQPLVSPPPPPPPPVAVPQPAVPIPQPVAPPQAILRPTPQDMMRDRQPLNQTASAQVSAPPPSMQSSPAIPISPAALRKSAEIAALEGDLPPVQGTVQMDVKPPVMQRPSEATVLAENQAPRDPNVAAALVDQPPVAGINPRFRPPSKF